MVCVHLQAARRQIVPEREADKAECLEEAGSTEEREGAKRWGFEASGRVVTWLRTISSSRELKTLMQKRRWLSFSAGVISLSSCKAKGRRWSEP